MKVDSYDLVTVESDKMTVDLITWRRYRNVNPGAVEQLLDDNPHLAELSRYSPFIPPTVQVRIPLNYDILKGRPEQKVLKRLYDDSDPTRSDVISILAK